MQVWVVTALFYPEEVSTGYITTCIAETLVESAEVGVICGPSNYQSKALLANFDLDPRIKIKRVSIPNLNKNNLFLRSVSLVLLTFGLIYKIILHVKKNDKVVVVTTPPTLIPIASFLKRLIGFKFVVIAHDVFPEILVPAGMFKKDSLVYKTLLNYFNYCYNRACRIIVIGEDVRKLFKRKLKNDLPVSTITNWADFDQITPDHSMNLSKYYNENFDNKICIQFAGNIGRVQGLETIFKILVECTTSNFKLMIIGDGALKSKLIELKKSLNLNLVSFIGSKPRSEQTTFINACDIGLVSIEAGMYGLAVPSKVYNIMAAGKPILYIGDAETEISLYIKEFNVGWAFTWDKKNELKCFLEKLTTEFKSEILEKGQNARNLVERKFQKEQVLELYRQDILRIE